MMDDFEFEEFMSHVETPMHEIEPNLYLGSLMAGGNEQFLREYSIKYIVQALDCSSDSPQFDGITYHFIAIEDSPMEDISKHLPGALRFIHQHLLEGEKVLVHCQAGVSRSASIVIAYLMGKYLINFAQASNVVLQKRKCIFPNLGFQKQLREIGEERLNLFLR
ncbi:unnamed protein product [Blepharisma stoltei]|uniref:Dual specificity protein phosphatase n=1 Tax=Blepharisma stoltei TaxID=1481888 RepID=A0AAU9IGU8_9CILI|nr:unnamed protein product [Blepharisma stoltei]